MVLDENEKELGDVMSDLSADGHVISALEDIRGSVRR
jgi:hypothetical protein